jgi:DtxR family Mn-dependent transcriptional regulator
VENHGSRAGGHNDPTATVEDYLAVLYVLERDNRPAHASILAEQIGVSLPTAGATVKRMVRDGWLIVEAHKVLRLTLEGRKLARAITRRHFMVEGLLREVLGVPWSRLHSEAHALEHAISDETMLLMEEKLHHPKTCPHGNPMPGNEGAVAGWIRLVDLKPGQGSVIKRIHELAEDNADLMAFLEQHELMPGAAIKVEEVLPFNQTMTVMVGERSVVLGLTMAQWIYVRPAVTER